LKRKKIKVIKGENIISTKKLKRENPQSYILIFVLKREKNKSHKRREQYIPKVKKGISTKFYFNICIKKGKK